MIENNNKETPKTPYELLGIECGKGWMVLIQPILDYIKAYNKDKEEKDKIVILQIKEKWGFLCIYVDNATDTLNNLIRIAEEFSGYICEMCGSSKDVGRTNGWISTLCKKCAKNKAEVDNFFPIQWHSLSEDKWYEFDEEGNETVIDMSSEDLF